LYNSGFTSFKELKKTSAEELAKVDGVDEAMAQNILQQLEKRREEAEERKEELKKKKEEEAEKKKEEEEKAEKEKEKKEEKKKETGLKIVEEGDEAFSVKQKPALSPEQKKLLKVRAEIKDRTPNFRRDDWYRYKRVDKEGWRRSKGMHSKMRMGYKYRPAMPTIGYGGPKEVRGLHPSGFEEVIIHTVDELESIEPKVQAARIGGSVGRKKKKEIEKKADELGIRVLNPIH
jgi:large subunit ribosomal protein L32e